MMGDFNSVRARDERRGVQEVEPSGYRREMRLFNDFFDKVELEDKNTLGRKFTWFHSNGVAMSRIDRVLVSEDWELVWGSPSLGVLPRDVSDHCPLLLKSGDCDWALNLSVLIIIGSLIASSKRWWRRIGGM